MTVISPATIPVLSLSYSHQVFTNVIIQSVAGVNIPIDSLLPGGSVTIDVTSVPMATITINIVIDEVALVAADLSTSTLAPTGSRIIVSSGIVDTSGNSYEWPVGIFVITSVVANDSGSGTSYTITGSDLSFIVNATVLIDNFNVVANSTLASVIIELLQQQVPSITLTNLIPNNTPLAPQTFQSGTTVFSVMQSLALQVGCAIYFDEYGILTTKFLPTGGQYSPVWIFDSTSPINTMVSLSYTVTASPGYNGVIVTAYSYNSSIPITATIWDTNPSSPLYYLGPYGQRPLVITSSNVVSQLQAEQIANLNYPLVIGETIQITVTCPPLPFLRPYAMVGVVSPNDKIDTVVMVSQHVLSLDYSTLDTITLAPVSTVTSQIVQKMSGLQNLPLPIYNGPTPYTYTPYTYTNNYISSSTTSSTTSSTATVTTFLGTSSSSTTTPLIG